MENSNSVKYFLPSISEVRLARSLMNQLIKDKHLVGDLLDDNIPMTVIDFSPFVDEKEKQMVASWLVPIPTPINKELWASIASAPSTKFPTKF